MSFYGLEEIKKLGLNEVGNNVKISKNASIYGAERISIGPNSRIDDFCVISAGEGGISIGKNVHIAVMCTLIGGGKIEIEDFCGLSGRVSLYSSNDDYSGEYLTGPTIPSEYTNVDIRNVRIERHAVIGSGSIILPGVVIGEGAIVGAMSLVKKNLAPFCMYAGSPLRKIKNRSNRLLEVEKKYAKKIYHHQF